MRVILTSYLLFLLKKFYDFSKKKEILQNELDGTTTIEWKLVSGT